MRNFAVVSFSNQLNKLRMLHCVVVSVSGSFFFGSPNGSGFCFLQNFQGLSKFRYLGLKAPGDKIKELWIEGVTNTQVVSFAL